ncbi:MAG: GTP-binding protein, partial [Myxococcota bacterium]
NKMDLVSEDGAREVEAIMRALNPGAIVIRATRGQVPLDKVLDTGLFDYDKAANSAGWIKELAGEHKPETEEYGITSFTYRTAQPFDAMKLFAFFYDGDHWEGVLRSKGFFWVAADHRVAYEWAKAGGMGTVNPMGMWWAAVPRERWPFPPEEGPDKKDDWHRRFGDRAQQLVFIGQNLDEEKMRAALDACLLDPKIAADDSKAWKKLRNPFPELQLGSG